MLLILIKLLRCHVWLVQYLLQTFASDQENYTGKMSLRLGIGDLLMLFQRRVSHIMIYNLRALQFFWVCVFSECCSLALLNPALVIVTLITLLLLGIRSALWHRLPDIPVGISAVLCSSTHFKRWSLGTYCLIPHSHPEIYSSSSSFPPSCNSFTDPDSNHHPFIQLP